MIEGYNMNYLQIETEISNFLSIHAVKLVGSGCMCTIKKESKIVIDSFKDSIWKIGVAKGNIIIS